MGGSLFCRCACSAILFVRIVVILVSLAGAACTSPEAGSEVYSSPARPTPVSNSDPRESPDLGEGFVVWESNRSGAWRIWRRELAESDPTRLTPNTPGRPQCCPHISPDGEWVAYLSLENAVSGYASGGNRGELRLVRSDGSDDRLLARDARSSHENRAVVWRNSGELIYLRGDGATVLQHLDGSEARVLIEGEGEATWLINGHLSYAASGQPDFSPYNPASARVAKRSARGGCQPYFTSDGRWGYWTASTGGPIQGLELESGRIKTILKKSDPRIPDGLGYAYFPMFSTDSRLFAFAASAYEHHHFKADYEVFVAESDPETLELLGDAVRITRHPATDRFPDVFLAPLALGRHSGEAPYAVNFEPGVASVGGGQHPWNFDFGDGSNETGGRIEHVFEAAGVYDVVARGQSEGQEPRRGRVRVFPPKPPRPITWALEEDGQSVVVRFDEEIDADAVKLEFDSGRTVADWSVSADRRALVVRPIERIGEFEGLSISGVTDRARRPNAMEPTTLDLEPPLWPSNRDQLAFLWESADAGNLVWDPGLGAERSCIVKARDRARLDRNFAMVLAGGAFVASEEDVQQVLTSCARTNEFALEAVITPREAFSDGVAAIISFSPGGVQGRNFLLAQKSDRLVFGPRAGSKGPGAYPLIEISKLAGGAAHHIIVTHDVARLVAYVDGEKVLDDEATVGGFFHWKPTPLVFGDEARGAHDWAGTLEGVAIYSRFLGNDEARENYLRVQRKLDQRVEVLRLVVEATLLERSAAPGLDEISPYREALSLFEYRVDRVLEGDDPGERVRVVEWSILDGQVLDLESVRPGVERRLVLEPFADNPQLESVFLVDEVDSRGAPLFYLVPD